MEQIWQRKTANFKVTCSYQYEPDPDLSWADQETLDQISNGTLGNFMFKVAVYDLGGAQLGVDYLGNSIYAYPEDFAKERGGYFKDMVSEAIREARRYYNEPRPRLRAA